MAIELGMYRVHDPSAPKLVVGRFTILGQKPGWLWIQNGEDEGIEIESARFAAYVATARLTWLLEHLNEEMVEEFWKVHA